ncbi:DUF1659 domain-containing protein [Oceanobacillus halophilus]|uniref:DUF1659 domain-containing protein n=1 Tax=Oceanobacillus halophilus TaxID=930130 RepID=A0A494ZV20_9BACI|nr:DUF1659 domain-containing protein [Oceanobacillus halophilus]RKQ30258.1 DUF1659 domain-containing protein [Oceanobacillus halophilus]
MATAALKNSTMQLVFNDGNDLETGLPVYKYKTFSNIKTTATPDQLHAVATTIASLQERPLFNVVRKDNSDIIGE